MTYVPKPNTGTLWPNEYKKTPNHPDVRGDIFFDRTFLQDMIDKCEGDLVKIQVSGWNKVIANKDCVSLSASAPYVKEAKPPAPSQPSDDEEIPF